METKITAEILLNSGFTRHDDGHYCRTESYMFVERNITTNRADVLVKFHDDGSFGASIANNSKEGFRAYNGKVDSIEDLQAAIDLCKLTVKLKTDL